MQLYPGAYQISSFYRGGRSLFQYLFPGVRILLVDGGVADTPVEILDRKILCRLRQSRLGLTLSQPMRPWKSSRIGLRVCASSRHSLLRGISTTYRRVG